jgi:MoxR-like ATPase
MDAILEREAITPGYEILPEEDARAAEKTISRIVQNIETVIKGKHSQVELLVLCLLAEGHVLIEDIPGVGKTSLVSALARTVDCGYKRIQFTPDVMPSDITGFSIYNQKSGEFEFCPGAAMSNIILADEINRASAKTQSAMLEIMAERQVTVDGSTHIMERPFIVLATQNPIDSLGTYKLPEAQIDRFMILISLGYPDFEDELTIVLSGKQSKADITNAADAELVKALIKQCGRVCVDRLVASYIVRIVEATRTNADIKLGASPRGSIALFDLARAYALSKGRNYVLPDDVKVLAPYVLAHRIILTHGAKTEKRNPRDIIKAIVNQVVVPTAKR